MLIKVCLDHLLLLVRTVEGLYQIFFKLQIYLTFTFFINQLIQKCNKIRLLLNKKIK